MSKKAVQQDVAHVDGKGRGTVLSQKTIVEEPYPTAEELAKLKEVDPSLVSWIMKRCEDEQEFRHTFDNQRLELSKKDLKAVFTINILTILIAFVLVAGGMFCSVYLILHGADVTGTIFAGSSVVAAVALFFRFSKRK